MARANGLEVKFLKVNGVRVASLSVRLKIKQYPALLLFEGKREVARYPEGIIKGPDSLLSFLNSNDPGNASWLARQRWRSAYTKVSGTLRVSKVESFLRLQRYVSDVNQMVNALGLQSLRGLTLDESTSRKDCPTLIFLGGGMASGKSSIIKLFQQTKFFQDRGKGIVVVEADALKMKDPVFKALSAMETEQAAELVHTHSTSMAESLFLTAVKQRRDIIFDGTMAWKEFIKQTVDMVRDHNNLYKRGPGYVQGQDGNVHVERYWEVERPRTKTDELFPYKIRLIGVTARPDVAVVRGITRGLIINRGVPIKEQLKSHKLFTQHFLEYVDWVDECQLYENDEKAVLVAEKTGKDEPFVIKDEARYQAFLRKATLDINAASADQLYPVEEKPGLAKNRSRIESTVSESVEPEDVHSDTGSRDNSRNHSRGRKGVVSGNRTYSQSPPARKRIFSNATSAGVPGAADVGGNVDKGDELGLTRPRFGSANSGKGRSSSISRRPPRKCGHWRQTSAIDLQDILTGARSERKQYEQACQQIRNLLNVTEYGMALEEVGSDDSGEGDKDEFDASLRSAPLGLARRVSLPHGNIGNMSRSKSFAVG